jgi:hypothetical protein
MCDLQQAGRSQETKSNDHGKAVHEECYVLRQASKDATQPACVRLQLAAIASLQRLRLASGVMALGFGEVPSARGFAGIQLHAEHPQAAKVLSSSQTICLAMAEHSPTGQARLLGHSSAGLQWQDVGTVGRY